MAEEAGPSNTTEPQTAEALAECDQKFEAGIKAIKDDEYEKAVQLFSDVLMVRAKHYGQLAPEVASAYYRYGCALLYQAQESADVFGGPIRGAAATDGDKENDGEAKPPPPRPEPIAHDDKGKRPAVEPIAEETADDAEDAEGEEGQRELDVEGDLQLAWENLEAARTIWSYSPDKHMNELADVHSQLADVNMENEAFEDALADIESAMDFHKKAGVGDDDRKVADLQFRKCMALQFIGRNKEALESVKDAMATLDRCKTKTTAEANGDDVPEEKKQAAIKTVKDLATVLDELKDKVEELNGVIEEEEATRGMVRGMVAQLAAAQQAQQGEGSALGPAATNNSDAQKVGASPVKDLGVVGRGTKRINLAPVSATETAAKPAANGEPAPKKRALEDMMGGSAAGETTVGFGGDKKEEAAVPAVPAFLQAFKAAEKTENGSGQQ